MSNDVITRLILESQTGDTKKKLDEVRAAQDRLSKEVQASATSTGKATDEYKELIRQLVALKSAETELERQLDLTNTKYVDRLQLNKSIERFDQTSKDVSLGGDVESNARTIGGAFGAFGLTGAEQGISKLAELPAVIEALPRLKEALGGLPQTIFAAVDSLGPAGLAFTAFAGVAIAVATALGAEAQKNADKVGALIDNLRELNQEIANGSLTTDEAKQRLEERNKQLEAETQLLNETQELYDRMFNSLDPLNQAQKKLTDALEDELSQQINKSTEAVHDYEAEIELLNDRLADGSLAAADAAEAERMLAEERTNALLDQAAFEGELEELRQRIADSTKEQIAREQEAIDRRIAALERELEVLEASGDSSEDVAQRIAEINEQLDKLGDQSDVLADASASAPSEDELKQAREESKQATVEATESTKANTDATKAKSDADKDAAREAEKAAQKQAQYADSLKQANDRYTQALEDIDTDLKDRLTDAGIEGNQELADLQSKFDQDELQRDTDHRRELARLRKDADRSERDALRQRNFAQLADTREDNQSAIEDAKREFEEEGQDRLTEVKYQHDEILTEEQRQTQELRRNADRQQRDAEIARDRAIDTAKQKLGVEQQYQAQSLALLSQFGGQFNDILSGIFGQALAGAGGGGATGNRSLNQRIDNRMLRITAQGNRFAANVGDNS